MAKDKDELENPASEDEEGVPKRTVKKKKKVARKKKVAKRKVASSKAGDEEGVAAAKAKKPKKKAVKKAAKKTAKRKAAKDSDAKKAVAATKGADEAEETEREEDAASSEESQESRVKKKAGAKKKKKQKADAEDPAAEEEGEDKKPKKEATQKSKSKSKEEPTVETEAEPEPEPEPEPDPGPPPPESIDLAEFQSKSVAELYELGASLGLRVGGVRSKHDLVFEILCHWGKRGTEIHAEGIYQPANEGYGFLRFPQYSFAPHADDIYIGVQFVREFGIRTGHKVKVVARAPRDRERFLSTDRVVEIEEVPADDWETPPVFENLTALSPRERIILERPDCVSPRVVDLIAPLGKGQRGVIVAPPRGGKTILLKEIAKSIVANHSEIELLILLLDERPEEVTDFEENVEGAQVYSSTFDESPERHVAVAELVAERAKRITELGKDAVILMDSLTRLARGYNGLISTRGGKKGGGKGRTGSGGLDTRSLPKARKIFNIARNAEEGGSLTMLATALIDTGSRADEVIFEEFKGSGNMEIQLDRELLERRIFPAIDIPKSGTRKDELLYHPDEFKRIGMLRRQLAQRPGGEAMEVLIHHIENSASNAELLMTGLR